MKLYKVWGESADGWVVVGIYDNPDEADRARYEYINSFTETYEEVK